MSVGSTNRASRVTRSYVEHITANTSGILVGRSLNGSSQTCFLGVPLTVESTVYFSIVLEQMGKEKLTSH